jgi:hypothetical protein
MQSFVELPPACSATAPTSRISAALGLAAKDGFFEFLVQTSNLVMLGWLWFCGSVVRF